MEFPSPPPLRTAARPSADPTRHRYVRLLTLVTIVFWVSVMGVLGAVFVWGFLGTRIAGVAHPTVLAVALNLLIALCGYWIGLACTKIILRDVARAVQLKKSNV